MGNVTDIRNIAICGHGSSGKTTLADKMLILSGAVKSNPSVEDGTSICDFDPVEKDHKYSVEASSFHFDFAGKNFNGVDTPGYPDFIGQAICGLSGVDTALITINAHAGIEVNSRRVFKEAGIRGLGRMIVLTKLDDDNIDFEALVNDIREMWGSQCVLLNVPIGIGSNLKSVVSTLKVPEDTAGAILDPKEISEPLMESIIEVDEAVMERYFEGQPPTDEELSRLIVQAVAEGSLVPILCTSARKDVGVQELLEAVAMCGLSPQDRKINATGTDQPITPDANGPLVAQVFRTRIDPFVQKLSFIRVYSGTLSKDDAVATSSTKKPIKMGPLFKVLGDQTSSVDSAGPGEIVAVAKMEDLHTGTGIGEAQVAPLNFPTPMVGLAVLPKSRGDEGKLSGALNKIVEEDQTLHLDRDGQTKELVMTGMSELHLQITQEKLKHRDKLEIETREPKIPFRETIQMPAEGMYRHKKQSGGRGQFGEVHIRMWPLPRETDLKEFISKSRFPSMKDSHYDEKHNFLWVDSVVGGVIPGNFMPAVEKGFREKLIGGVIAGHMVQDVCVEVHFGKHHPVDSSEAAFKTAGRMAFKQVFEKAKPSLLEPVVKLEVTVPESNVGDVYSDMSSRGGRVLGSDAAGGNFQTIHCEVPLREVTTYSRTVSSMTGGMGSFAMEFSHYEVMPPNIQQEVVSKSTRVDGDEEE